MKTIKLIILSLLVFAGERLMAQNIIINNNTWFAGGTADFIYNPPCGNLPVPFPVFGNNTQPYLCAANPTNVNITFNDPSCPPALNPRLVTISTATLPATIFYTGCNGIIYSFRLDNVGADWILDIN